MQMWQQFYQEICIAADADVAADSSGDIAAATKITVGSLGDTTADTG